jgi:hypothetical protein
LKYIFLAGAPGSKWSSIAKHIYPSPDLDTSDHSITRRYWHAAWGEPLLMHMGAYWDPGMEFGEGFDRLSSYSKQESEKKFDEPFSGTGIRVIKSHVFCHHLDFLRYHWPECPIILVDRPDDACLGWWVRCGGFSITYPLYDQYYRDLATMAEIISLQNRDLRLFKDRNSWVQAKDSSALCRTISIRHPADYRQDYIEDDINVTIIR